MGLVYTGSATAAYRSTSASGGRRGCTPGMVRARGHVVVVAHLQSLVRLGRVAGIPGAAAVAGGAIGRSKGGLSACRRTVLTPPSRAAFQAIALLVKDLEE